jgi:chromate reductase, NAD(P)H dehydrogenase (quinone)
MNILAFAASNSKKSINKKLVTYTANLVKKANVEILDLNDYEMPIYSVDKEAESGIPQLATDFYQKLGNADFIMISFAEYNGSYTAAFKNIFDWTSRINNKTFQNKPMLLLSTSPGPRGGATVLEIAKNRFSFQGGNIVGSFSLPSFNDNFDNENGIISITLKESLQQIITQIEAEWN